MKKLSIVIPVFNELATIKDTLVAVFKVGLPNGWEREVIVVDDGSTDGTSECLKDIKLPFKTFRLPVNKGKGAALKLGFANATGDYILIQDADLEYNPNDYRKLFQPISDKSAKVVFGSRVLGKNPVPLKRILYHGGILTAKVFNFFFRTKITDIATCYKIFSKEYAVDLVKFKSNDFVFDIVEMTRYLSRKATIFEVPIDYEARGRSYGKKLNWKHGIRCLWRIVSIFSAEMIKKALSIAKYVFGGTISFIKGKNALKILLTFSLFFIIFSAAYFSLSNISSGDDHFFHFRFAQQMLNSGFFHSFQDFKSIYISKMAQGNDYFMYYNFIFYAVIMPFTFIDPLYLGIKLYAVFAAASAFTLLYWCLKRFSVKNPFVLTILIMGVTNVALIWRFFLSRPYTLAPSLLLLLLFFLYKKNRAGVFIVSFAYLYWHSSTFFMPLCVVAAYFLIERFYGEKSDWKTLLSSMGGTVSAIALAYLVSSGFLLFIKDTLFNIYWETIVGKKVAIHEGMELYPIDFFNYIKDNIIISAAFITAIAVDLRSYLAYKFKKTAGSHDYFAGLNRNRRYLHTSILLISICFFLGTIAISGRFSDFFTFFAAIYIAISFDYFRRSVSFVGNEIVIKGLKIGAAISLIYAFSANMIFLNQQLSYGPSSIGMLQTGGWLERNTKAGDVVFNSDWGWFPQLYYYSPKDYYVSGLEPRFTYDYSPRLYWLSVHMPSDGTVCELEKCPELDNLTKIALLGATSTKSYAQSEGDKMADILTHDFHASYVVTSNDYKLFNYILSHNNHFIQKFYDSNFGFSIFEVKPNISKK